MLFVGTGRTLVMFLIAGIFGAFGHGTGLPSIQAYCVKTVDETSAGVATSTIMIGQNVANAVAPVIGSFFIRAFDYGATFAGAGGFIFAVGILFTLVQWKINQKYSVEGQKNNT